MWPYFVESLHRDFIIPDNAALLIPKENQVITNVAVILDIVRPRNVLVGLPYVWVKDCTGGKIKVMNYHIVVLVPNTL